MIGWLGFAKWAALASFGLAVIAIRQRTRGFDAIAPDLRSPLLRVRTPSVNALLLRIGRLVPATSPVEGVEMASTFVTSSDGAEITVHTYRPAGFPGDLPVMLYMHGGGLIAGSAASYHAAVSGYARDLGIVVASVEYRLAPEHPFPAALCDIHAAYGWLRANASALRIDPARIAVGGDSAGGGLAAALCQRLLDSGEPMPVFQWLIYPMLDDRTTLKPAPEGRGQLIWTEKSNRFAWKSYLGQSPTLAAAPDYAAPARRQDLAGLPPAWIGVGTLDLFYDEDVAYALRLQRAGVPCQLDVVEGAFHAFDQFKGQVAQSFKDRALEAVRQAVA